ncbi:hypothetical protein FB451DRAFT_1164991 [Mycena latifolia]|nr:hypothetical protein FB451DRAFT_1164991 [Mycena latifolia]
MNAGQTRPRTLPQRPRKRPATARISLASYIAAGGSPLLLGCSTPNRVRRWSIASIIAVACSAVMKAAGKPKSEFALLAQISCLYSPLSSLAVLEISSVLKTKFDLDGLMLFSLQYHELGDVEDIAKRAGFQVKLDFANTEYIHSGLDTDRAALVRYKSQGRAHGTLGCIKDEVFRRAAREARSGMCLEDQYQATFESKPPTMDQAAKRELANKGGDQMHKQNQKMRAESRDWNALKLYCAGAWGEDWLENQAGATLLTCGDVPNERKPRAVNNVSRAEEITKQGRSNLGGR